MSVLSVLTWIVGTGVLACLIYAVALLGYSKREQFAATMLWIATLLGVVWLLLLSQHLLTVLLCTVALAMFVLRKVHPRFAGGGS